MSVNVEHDEEGQPLFLTDRQIQQVVSSRFFTNRVRDQLDAMLKSHQEQRTIARTNTIVTGTLNVTKQEQSPNDDHREAKSLLSFFGHGGQRCDNNVVEINIPDRNGTIGINENGETSTSPGDSRSDEVMSLRLTVQALEEKVAAMEANMNEREGVSSVQDHQAQVPTQQLSESGSGLRGTIMFRNFNTFTRGLDEDTFSLMSISHPNSQAWFLGLVAFAFQITLGLMIAMNQIIEGVGSSVFNIPFRVDPVVRVGQALTVILCLSTQSDIFSAIQYFIVLRRGSNWREMIHLEGESSSQTSSCLTTSWLMMIAFPNSLKLIQGFLVLFISFVIIVQSDNIISLLKDFTALMVLSETDNILFQLADMGYLGDYLQNKASEVKEIEIEEVGEDQIDHRNINPCTFLRKGFENRRGGWRARTIGLFSFFLAFLGGWGVIVYRQENGTYFAQRYPNCTSTGRTDKEMFRLAKEHFDDGKCYGGQLNTLGCKFEGGDCVDINLAYPLCKGDQYVNVQELLENGRCDLTMNTKECGYDAAQCCPLNITSQASFGDGQCNGGQMNTELCHNDDGDCDAFVRDFPNCPLDEIAEMKGSSEIILGDGICEGGLYANDECGLEFRDCDAGQIGQDVIFRGASSGSTIDFHSVMNNDGSKVMISMFKSGANNTGKVKVYGYDSDIGLWSNLGADLSGEVKDGLFGNRVAMSGDGDRIVVGIPNYNNMKGKVIVFGFNKSLNEWVQLGQDLIYPDRPFAANMGYSVGMSHDGTRIVIGSPLTKPLDGNIDRTGSIQIWEMEESGLKWEMMGNEIFGNEREVVGLFYARLNYSGTRVYFSAGYFDRATTSLRSYEYNEGAWTQLGTDIRTPNFHDYSQPAISADGSRVAVSSYTQAESVEGVLNGRVSVFDLDENSTIPEWKEVGVPIESEEKRNGDGFGYSISMSADGTLLAISMLDPNCLGALGWCPTGSIRLYKYSARNPHHRIFSRVASKKNVGFANVMQSEERDADGNVFGWDISLSGDASKISVSGHDYDKAYSFVKVYDVDSLFYPDCMVHNPEFIGDGTCLEFEPYYTAQCGYDGGDCPTPLPVDGYPECYVRLPSKVGDTTCNDFFPYNTKQCGYDGGDCETPVQVEGYPECYMTDPSRIGNGICQGWEPYYTIECGFDGGDCPVKNNN